MRNRAMAPSCPRHVVRAPTYADTVTETLDPGHPRDVLDRLRRLEIETAELRARPDPISADDLAGVVEELLAADRGAAIEDLECLLEVVAAGWRATRRELGAVRAELEQLRSELADGRAVAPR